MPADRVLEAGSRAPRWTTWAIAFGMIALGLVWIGRGSAVDLDIFHEMALIRQALELGRIPVEDAFSYTSTVTPVVHHEWGTGAVLYFFVVTLGLGTWGLAILRLFLLAGTVACCISVARSRGAAWRDMVLVAPVLCFLFLSGLSPVRAHMFTFLFVAVLLVLLERERLGDRRWLFLWPPLFVLWLNVHGGFVVGIGVLALYTIERCFRAWRAARAEPAVQAAWVSALRETRHLFLALGSTAPLLLVNPYGPAYVPYIWHALSLERPFITEWHPIWSPQFGGVFVGLFLASGAIAAYTVWRGDSWSRLPGILVLVVTAVLTARSSRLFPILGVIWFPYVAAALAATPVTDVTRRRWRRHARPVAAVAVVVGLLSAARVIQTGGLAVHVATMPGDDTRVVYPAGAVAYLSEIRFTGNLMTPFGVGAYVSWNLYPRVKVGLDSRYEVAYHPGFVEETIRFYRGERDWREYLGRHPTDAVLVPGGSALDSLMSAPIAHPVHRDPAWVQVFRDDAYAIFATVEAAERMPPVDRQGRRITGRLP